MFLTRSIRRKLIISLSFVACMIAAFGACGLAGIMTFRSVVSDLDFALNRAPRQADLEAALAGLFEPLLTQPTTEATRKARHDIVAMRLALVEQELLTFRRKLDQLPPSESARLQRNPAEAMLTAMDVRLQYVRQRLPALLTEHGEAVSAELMLANADLITRVRRLPTALVPSSQEGLSRLLDSARRHYLTHFWALIASGAVVAILFCVLSTCGFRWIFRPIRLLHLGAKRVAQGDFSYRVQLSGHDEIVELASTFNEVAERFHQIKQQLNEEVEQRSRQLIRSERLAGVGFLAAGIAHEINNPLSAIALAAESLEGRLHTSQQAGTTPTPEDLDVFVQYLAMIQREAFRCQQITSRLLDFARGHDGPRMRQDLTRLVGEVIDMVRHLSKFRGHQIELQRTTPLYAEVNGAEIKQVVLNLVANALESTEGDGKLRVDLIDDGDEIRMQFQDNGCGMTPDVLQNLFEPFFTARKSGKGTGLGLSISHRIITDHGGQIQAASSGPGLGSTLTVRLPSPGAASRTRAA